jgi:hypothetical protein
MFISAARCGWLVGLLTALVLTTGRAHAVEALYGGEHYQEELLRAAQIRHGLEPEPSPQGKIIERVVAVPYDVFLAEDPYPGFLNWFHVTTLPPVIERELLFKAGDAWTPELVAESARNIRSYLFVSVARVVAAKGSAPDKVVAMVVTKDTWSLRTNAEFQFVGSQLQFLDAQLTEENLLGRRKRATFDLGLNLAVYYAGLQYRDPRIFGSGLNLIERGDLFWNRLTHELEGGVANITLQQPLYTLDAPWAWIADFKYRKDIYRLFSLGEVAQAKSAVTGESIPYEFNRHQLDLQVGLARSTGREHKRDFSFGYRAFVHLYDVLAQPVQVATLRDFEASALPLSESVGQVYVGFRSYQANYRELLDIDSFAITEDYRLGLDFASELRLANPVFGFDSQYLQPVVSATWTSYASGNLFAVTGSAEVRYQPQLASSSPWANGWLTAGVRNVTPRFSIFRLHTGLRGGKRFNDFNHSLSALGSGRRVNEYVPNVTSLSPMAESLAGGSSLRGYPEAYFLGANYWNGNVELRTAPIAVSTVHLGLAAFFDIGSAANELSRLTPHASAGGGLRIGLPQFNQEVFRIDFGIPFERIVGASPAYIVAQYGQAF